MDSIIGQKDALKTIRTSLAGDRLHHAWIFSGPRGVGKCSTAMAFGRSLLGTALLGHEADLHYICKEDVAWAQNPALQKRKQTNIPIDLLRERIIGGKTSDGKTCDAVAYKTPFAGKRKVFIIDEAELLDEAGQNALLKTLEEPPCGTTIILVTSREDILLPTIISRCQSVRFSPLLETDMAKWVESCPSDVSGEELSWASACSCGSPGIVCEILKTGLFSLMKDVSRFLTWDGAYLYTEASEHICRFIERSIATWTAENGNASKEALNRAAFTLILLMFAHSARGYIRGAHVGAGVASVEILVDIESQLGANISIKVLVESLAARWSHLCAGSLTLT